MDGSKCILQLRGLNRSGHHVRGNEFDAHNEYDGIIQKSVLTIDKKGLAAVQILFVLNIIGMLLLMKL